MVERFARLEVSSRAQWRAWLEANHGQREPVWLVRWKKGRGPFVPVEDIVREALCFGWVDSRVARLDEDRSLLLLAPRRAGSAWSAVNKRFVAELEAAGLLQASGRAAIERAQRDGTWTALDEVETLQVPDDLAAALAAHPPASERWDAFPRSSRRGILEWIAAAKRPQTRAARVVETAAKAAVNRKANFPAGRDAGPQPRTSRSSSGR